MLIAAVSHFFSWESAVLRFLSSVWSWFRLKDSTRRNLFHWNRHLSQKHKTSPHRNCFRSLRSLQRDVLHPRVTPMSKGNRSKNQRRKNHHYRKLPDRVKPRVASVFS